MLSHAVATTAILEALRKVRTAATLIKNAIRPERAAAAPTHQVADTDRYIPPSGEDAARRVGAGRARLYMERALGATSNLQPQ